MNNLLLFINLSIIVVLAYASNDNIFIEASRQSLRDGEVTARKVFLSSTIQQRRKRHGFPPVPFGAPFPVAAPAPVAAPVYAQPYPAYQAYAPPAQFFQQPPPPPQFQIPQPQPQPPAQFFQQPIVQQPVFQQAIPQPVFQQPPPPPQFQIPQPQPSIVEPPVSTERFPLPSCYTDSSNFLCCNCALENVMDQSYQELRNERGPQWNNANVQEIANRIQNNSQSMFGEDFEVVVGLGDFVTASHFYKDLLCKVEIEGRYMVAYATPHADSEYYDEGIGGFLSAQPGIHSKSSAGTCDSQAASTLNKNAFGDTQDPYLLNKYVNVTERGFNLGNVAFSFRI